MPKSTYFFEASKKDPDECKNKDICDKIREIFKANKGRYGVRRVAAELRNSGFEANHKKVQRLMAKMGLRAKPRKKRYKSYKGEVGKVAPNLIKRDFSASKPNEKWTTDVSQFNCPFGKAYLSPIIDMYNGEVVSWDLSESPDLEQTRRMLDSAFSKHKSLEGLIFHSDQGWQYQNAYYVRRLEEKGIRQSMSRKGNCYDNSIMESFFGRLNEEMFYGHESEFKTFRELEEAISEYMDYYNNERIRGRIGWMAPAKYREAHQQGAML